MTDHEKLIRRYYRELEDGFDLDTQENKIVRSVGGNPTYGEITLRSTQKLLDQLCLTANDVFYDLGSGTGKMVAYVYLASPVRKSVGIELAPTRHEQAAAVKKRLKDEGLLQPKRYLVYKQENIAESNLSDATVIYMCATCYSNKLLKEVIQNIATIKRPVRIITLKELPDHKTISFVKEERLPMTWARNVEVFHYLYEPA